MNDFQYESKDLTAMAAATHYHRWVLSTFKEFLGRRVAEVGAGNGNFSTFLLAQPIDQLIAIEPSSKEYADLKRRVGSDPRVTAANGFFPDVSGQYKNYFDSVVYVDVLEHVYDDADELRLVYQSLKPGGHVCIFVPALSWLYSEHDRSIGHYRRYHKKPLITLLQQAGFKIVRVHYFDFVGIAAWWIMFKVLKKKPNSNNVGFYDKLIVPISRFVENVIQPPIGKNLLIVGKKLTDKIFF